MPPCERRGSENPDAPNTPFEQDKPAEAPGIGACPRARHQTGLVAQRGLEPLVSWLRPGEITNFSTARDRSFAKLLSDKAR